MVARLRLLADRAVHLQNAQTLALNKIHNIVIFLTETFLAKDFFQKDQVRGTPVLLVQIPLLAGPLLADLPTGGGCHNRCSHPRAQASQWMDPPLGE